MFDRQLYCRNCGEHTWHEPAKDDLSVYVCKICGCERSPDENDEWVRAAQETAHKDGAFESNTPESCAPVPKSRFRLALVAGLVGVVMFIVLTAWGIGSVGTAFDALQNEAASGINSIAGAPGFGMSDKADMAPTEDTGGVHDPGLAQDRKLVRTAAVRAETKAYDDYMAWLETELDAAGGYMENTESESRTRGQDEYRVFHAVLRVPADRLDGVLDGIDGQGSVVYQSQQVDDVTLQYSDMDARLGSLRAEQEALDAMFRAAETVEDLIVIQDRLADVSGEIESYERQLRDLASQVAMARIDLTVTEVVDYSEPGPMGFWDRCLTGMKSTASGMARFAQDALVLVISALPVLLPAGIVIAAALVVHKKRKNRVK